MRHHNQCGARDRTCLVDRPGLLLCYRGEGQQAPAAEALKSVGPTLGQMYTFEPFHPAMPDHFWMDAGNGRGCFLMSTSLSLTPRPG
ncbi:MAG: hypothetical protein L0Z46_10160 [Nitrospiraceae bacterium]|nr:hypothetical protein [Nitrospiraceae bacterium]